MALFPLSLTLTFNGHEHEKGTLESMSLAMRTAMDRGTPYMQSPTDDLQSFWWVTLWAAVNNPNSPTTDVQGDPSFD